VAMLDISIASPLDGKVATILLAYSSS